MSGYKHFILIGNKRYAYVLEPKRRVTTLICKSANLATRVPNNEVPQLLSELPRIIARHIQSADEHQDAVLRFRVTEDEKAIIEQTAAECGYDSVSAYLRDVALPESAKKKCTITNE